VAGGADRATAEGGGGVDDGGEAEGEGQPHVERRRPPPPIRATAAVRHAARRRWWSVSVGPDARVGMPERCDGRQTRLRMPKARQRNKGTTARKANISPVGHVFGVPRLGHLKFADRKRKGPTVLRTRRGVFTLAAATATLLFGIGASPALAGSSHPWEATSPHYTSRQQADSVAARAKRAGVQTVIQVIGSHNIEVEYANGFSSRHPAEAVCAKVHSKGLPCQVEVEGHGVPNGWGHS
jgi:hypothetical protein